MKTKIKPDIKKIRQKMLPIFKKYSVVKAGIFGSVARGEAGKNSDMDVLVQFKGRKSLLDLAGLELELEKKIGKKMEVLTYDSIHPLLKKKILAEEISIL